jgi:uncharacterized protein (DUF2235 family)
MSTRGKNIVLFFDGTANEIATGIAGTNVVRLYRAVTKGADTTQVVFYDPGVGTFGSTARKTRIGRKGSLILDRAFGRGIKQNVSDGYEFLMEHYEPGDRIYLFGFSRGAYTARALAALLQGFGLLKDGRYNLVQYALKYFWRGKNRDQQYFEIAGRFKSYFSQPVDIEFMGLWETVSSIGWARWWFSLPWTDNLDSVNNAWQALAIDEQRNPFTPDLWTPRTQDTPGDFRQVWFSGVHSDVGGTFEDHRLADITLTWLATGAAIHGLSIDHNRIPNIGPGHALGELHPNLFPMWWIATFSTRPIPADSQIHTAVGDNIDNDPDYNPTNIDQASTTDATTPPWPSEDL